ncbi:hypothetical protein H5410_001436 [Solanum commersonii]|uniref:Uncharacterized protein n=1 Tax=Solanum commersonii TaxID=4109 RepID=A0A9J6B051_SOLCO|nr:hypothetical protein H5410_001436 [Solanum commersonii]
MMDPIMRLMRMISRWESEGDERMMDPDRSWMYNRNNPGRAGMIPEFTEGVTKFINHAKTLDDFLTSREKKREEEITATKEEGDENDKSDKESEGDENGKFDKESEGDEE